ncbi:MAG TPA: phosphopantothenate/pantothenate synthetase [Candidatus Syntrophoarchaeum butanivorans]|uniref:4-phosphopantoate--beta-alanine ligase n=1 Tax=Candidatus Syntropharchaeum butanivorans TaxID=1839936 RepID=A0A7C1B3Y6_9EURY|nr:MAG: phosphopantothenate/pantothenate synthetase [Candidatus Syntrophoarchaeum sp. WYZ-LMO15]HDM36499.1 phosphopantothenate/pantothenate synthetase [Candidatus Syntrophoarchaeum butanivorans]
MTEIPKDHPRYESLALREEITRCVEAGITSRQGLIAHGRGEAIDYLIGEKTLPSALEAEEAAVAALLTSKNPVISVNGNTAALVPGGIVELAELVGAKIEVNLFHRTEERVARIKEYLESFGAKDVLGLNPDATIPGLSSERAKVSKEGIFSADTVLVPLEDGDRCEALIGMGKTVIAIDLNPFSRTSRMAHISIVDNVVRAIPNMIKSAKSFRYTRVIDLLYFVYAFDNRKNLEAAVEEIKRGLDEGRLEESPGYSKLSIW